MSYAETLLASGERILRRDHQHWFIVVAESRWAVGALALAALLVVVGANLDQAGAAGGVRQVLGFATLLLVVGGLIWLVWAWLRWRSEEYVITNRRVIHTEGVINKEATDSSLEKINDAILRVTWIGRLFGFGDLHILTASEAGIDELRMLVNAPAFKRAMVEAKHEYELEIERGPTPSPPLRAPVAPGRPGAVPIGATPAAPPASPESPAVPPAAAPPRPSAPLAAPPRAASRDMTPEEVTRTLNSLADLRDRGAITAEDYEAKKTELLGRL